MVSTFTPNINWEQPARGDDVGTWDTPVNNNGSLIDLVTGGITTIGLNNANVTLSAAQFQSKQITFNSTLTGSVTITFPSTFKKSYEIQHLCTGTSAFTITLATTVAGGQVICCPPGETIDCFNDGTNIKFKNLGRVGSYWDHAGSSVPSWVSGCTVPPYLNCDGTSFSSATYPQLNVLLQGTTLPDSKGRFRAVLDQSAGRLSSGVIGFSPNTVGAAGSLQTVTLNTSNMPPYTPTVASINLNAQANASNPGGPPSAALVTAGNFVVPVTGTITMNPQGGVSAPVAVIPPTYMGGITMIRAA